MSCKLFALRFLVPVQVLCAPGILGEKRERGILILVNGPRTGRSALGSSCLAALSKADGAEHGERERKSQDMQNTEGQTGYTDDELAWARWGCSDCLFDEYCEKHETGTDDLKTYTERTYTDDELAWARRGCGKCIAGYCETHETGTDNLAKKVYYVAETVRIIDGDSRLRRNWIVATTREGVEVHLFFENFAPRYTRAEKEGQ